MHDRRHLLVFVALVALLVAVMACTGGDGAAPDSGDVAVTPSTAAPTTAAPTTSTTEGRPAGSPAPDWLGTRVLPLRPDGLGEVQPTPPELVDRRLWTDDVLAPPAGATFESSVAEVPAEVVARSTWQDACPVGLDELRYVTVSFFGFDGLFHTGELLVHRDAADDLVEVFRRLHDARFPIEEMRITRADELDLPPTGDGNVTGAFVCRPITGGAGWSEHAYGLAIDVNPFHNPYAKGDLVLPELASAYLDRSDVRPGMVVAGDVATEAFAAIGWQWGGAWNSLKDYQHFSANGR